MDNERARLILSAYRSGGADATDPAFAGALDQARQDPETRQWFGEQHAFDNRMSRALKEIKPPEQLRASILLSNKIVPLTTRTPWFFKPQLMTLAASILCLLGAAAYLMTKPGHPMALSELTAEVVHLTGSNLIALGDAGEPTAALHQWLAARRAPHDFAFPVGLAGKEHLGCQVYSIQGHKVSLICTKLEGDHVVHYFVIRREELANPPPAGLPVFVEQNGVAYATWSDKSRTYVMIHTGDAGYLRRLL